MEAGLPDALRTHAERARVEEWAAYPAGLGEDAPRTLLLRARGEGARADAISDDDPDSTSLTARRTPLASHGEAVGTTARRFAEHVGLGPSLIAAVAEGGRWHDLGKLDPRFQTMLHDGDRLAALAAPEPLAKSGRDGRDPIARHAWRLSGLPRRFRHEAVSALLFDALVARSPDRLASEDRQLVRHLIVSHHGNARPLLPPMRDADPTQITAEVEGAPLQLRTPVQQVDWGQPARFEQLGASQQAIRRAISAGASGGTILRGRRTLRRPRKGSLSV